ncbi:hypothetical protein BDD12DRAFT_46790 [Trichophaea hybrida]|nr:hypothetical protein BDD12DRAFT_46790 [Trichophaea hybrida]
MEKRSLGANSSIEVRRGFTFCWGRNKKRQHTFKRHQSICESLHFNLKGDDIAAAREALEDLPDLGQMHVQLDGSIVKRELTRTDCNVLSLYLSIRTPIRDSSASSKRQIILRARPDGTETRVLSHNSIWWLTACVLRSLYNPLECDLPVWLVGWGILLVGWNSMAGFYSWNQFESLATRVCRR